MSIQNNLRSISELYKTDKLEHGYIEIYDSYFKDLRNKELKVLEIGVADGKSLLTWSDYFKNSTIIGIDIHKIDIKEKKLDRKNIKVHQGSQSDEKFIKEISLGDRRIILIDGEYVGSVARIPAKNSIKANFHAGGSAKKTNLVFRDKKICNLLKPFLKKKGLFFVGIDTIGNYLTEINITSPTGAREILSQTGQNPIKTLLQSI